MWDQQDLASEKGTRFCSMVARCYERYVDLFLKDVTIIACMPSKPLCFLSCQQNCCCELKVWSSAGIQTCVCVCFDTHAHAHAHAHHAIQIVPLTCFLSWGAGKPWKTLFVLLGLILQMLAHRKPALF